MTSLSTTGNDVRDALAAVTGDLMTDDVKYLSSLNLAIGAAWPSIRLTERALAVATLSTGVFDYSLTALTPSPHRDTGISKVFIQEGLTTNAPDVSHYVWQYFDTSADAWFLRFSPSQVAKWNGQAINVLYQYPHAKVTAVTDPIYLPQTFLVWYLHSWVVYNKADNQDVDTKNMLQLYDRAVLRYKEELSRNMTDNLSSLAPAPSQRLM